MKRTGEEPTGFYSANGPVGSFVGEIELFPGAEWPGITKRCGVDEKGHNGEAMFSLLPRKDRTKDKKTMSLYLHYKPTKVDLVRGILDYWDPVRAKGTEHWYENFYNYEAETIAQTLRKNSKPESVAKNIKKLIDHKLELEEKEYRVDMDNAERVAASMIAAVKNMR